MGYLIIPSYSGVQDLRVPFRHTLTLDVDCLFTEFPDRHGFRSCWQLDWDRPRQIADFVQSWLYFGLINELYGTDLGLADFKTVDSEGEASVRLDRL